MYGFITLQVCYRHIDFFKFDSNLTKPVLDHYTVIVPYFVYSPSRVDNVSFQCFACMLQIN